MQSSERSGGCIVSSDPFVCKDAELASMVHGSMSELSTPLTPQVLHPNISLRGAWSVMRLYVYPAAVGRGSNGR